VVVRGGWGGSRIIVTGVGWGGCMQGCGGKGDGWGGWSSLEYENKAIMGLESKPLLRIRTEKGPELLWAEGG